MLKFCKVSILAYILLLISSCGNGKLLKEVNDVAVVTIKFNRTVEVVTQEQFNRREIPETVDLFSAANALTGGKAKALEKLSDKNEDEIEFYDNFINKLNESLNSTSLTIKSPSTYSSNEGFKSEDISNKFSTLSTYIPNGYINTSLNKVMLGNNKEKSGSEVSKRLTELLGVDAVASISLNFVQIKPKNILGKKKLGIIGYLIMKNKEGKTVFNRGISVTGSKYSFGFSSDSAEFKFTPKNKIYLKELQALFFAELDSIILKTLSKK
jgi:hypothetical protein